ncbi:MAG: hypothetical protein RMI89_01560 [Gloeomargarita sp. SKYBB_i_bin120]|nr:hypothetical protein [Gloeomargarita sp. SKYB120]MDW8177208.1 hypothetical protein [Gloeomargarita sp. SKYBB_i_bin120]
MGSTQPAPELPQWLGIGGLAIATAYLVKVIPLAPQWLPAVL